MRRVQVIGYALFATLGFSVFASAPAFAVSEWLVQGEPVLVALLAETEGTLMLSMLEGEAVLDELQCSLIMDGKVGPGAADEITKWLNLMGEEIGLALVLGSLPLSCEIIKTAAGSLDCELTAVAEVWPDNLPWKTEIKLMGVAPEWLDAFGTGAGGVPGYYMQCKAPLGTVSELCEGNTSAELVNLATMPPSVEVLFGEKASSEKSSCTLLGAGKGDIAGELLTWALVGGLRVTTAIS